MSVATLYCIVLGIHYVCCELVVFYFNCPNVHQDILFCKPKLIWGWPMNLGMVGDTADAV